MQSDPMKLGPGGIVASRYRIERSIGEGGFGVVFAATDLTLGRSVALKVLLPHIVAQEDGLRRFRREAKLAQQLQHPNTVRLYEFGVTEDATPYIAWELLKGQPLDTLLRQGPLPTARVARIAAQVLKSLMEAHGLGIIHRDIKPSNIFLCDFSGEPDFVKVLDFGIAKEMSGQGYTAAGLTQAGQSLGTPSYMSPEQITGAGMSPAGDLYALGLVMAEALTGEVVFKGESGIHIVVAQMSNDPAPLGPDVLRSALGPAIHRATQKSRDRRYTAAAEMLKDVEDAMRGAAGPQKSPVDEAPQTGAAAALAHGATQSAAAQAGYAQTHAAAYSGPFAGSTPPIRYGPPPPQARAPSEGSPGYGAAFPYHPHQAPRAPSGPSAGVILAIVGGALGLLGGLLIVVFVAIGLSSTPRSEPGATAGPAERTPTTVEALGDLTQDTLRRKIEGEGWKVVNETQSKSGGVFSVIYFTIQQSGKFGVVQLYHYEDAKSAQAVAEGMLQQRMGALERDGKTFLLVIMHNDLEAAQQLLDKLLGR